MQTVINTKSLGRLTKTVITVLLDGMINSDVMIASLLSSPVVERLTAGYHKACLSAYGICHLQLIAALHWTTYITGFEQPEWTITVSLGLKCDF